MRQEESRTRALLAALHGIFALAALVLLASNSDYYLAYVFAWAPGLVALAAIAFILHLPDSRHAVIMAAAVALFSFGPATGILDLVLSAGLFEGHSRLSWGIVAAFLLLLALETWTIRFVSRGKEGEKRSSG